MELVIKSLQVIVSGDIDIAETRRLVGTMDVIEPTTDNCRNVLDYGFNYSFSTKNGVYHLYGRTLFDSSMRLVGVYGKLNENIVNLVRANRFAQTGHEFFIDGDRVDGTFVSLLKRRNSTPINVLTAAMFETLCNSMIRIEEERELLNSLMQDYLQNNFGIIENLNILNEEHPLERTPMEPTPTPIPPRADVVFVDDVNGETLPDTINAEQWTNTIVAGNTQGFQINPGQGLWNQINAENLQAYRARHDIPNQLVGPTAAEQLLVYLQATHTVDLNQAMDEAIDAYINDNAVTEEADINYIHQTMREVVAQEQVRLYGVADVDMVNEAEARAAEYIMTVDPATTTNETFISHTMTEEFRRVNPEGGQTVTFTTGNIENADTNDEDFFNLGDEEDNVA